MEGVYYGYYLKSVNDIKQKKLNTTISVETMINNATQSDFTPLFGTHPKNESLSVSNYNTISYSTFMNPVYTNKE